MFALTEIGKPLINIELYGTDTHIPPIDKVRVMDEDSFEQFILEWLYCSKKDKYETISKIGGSGDKGRDIIASYSDGTKDYYQCKHYSNALAPTDYYLELAKLCYYTYTNDIPMPKSYYIIASNDVGPGLQDLIDNPTSLLEALVVNWDNYCKTKITRSKEIPLEGEFLNYVKAFNFSIIHTYPISKIINDHVNTIYGKLRFGGQKIVPPNNLSPSAIIEKQEMPYIEALLEAYSEELKVDIDTVEALKSYKYYFEHLNRQRKDFYCAETVRRFVRDTLTDSIEFDVLKNEVYNGIIDTHEQHYDTGYKRLVEDLKQASLINTSKSKLDSQLHCIGSSERKGTCHMLVNDNKLRWVDKI